MSRAEVGNRLVPGAVSIGHFPHGECAFLWCHLPAEDQASVSVGDLTAAVHYRFCPEHGRSVRATGCHPTGVPQLWDFGAGHWYSDGSPVPARQWP